MKLYFSPGSCSLASHITLSETGIKFETSKVDMKNKKADGKDFKAISPMGYVPALEIAPGKVLTEGVAILQYVADQKPELNLLPKNGTWERYKAQEWLNFIATELHKTVSPLWSPNTDTQTREGILARLGARFDFLNSHLKNQNFLLGNNFSAADAYLFTILSWTPMLKIDMSKWTALLAYSEKIKMRPAVQTALKNEGLLN